MKNLLIVAILGVAAAAASSAQMLPGMGLPGLPQIDQPIGGSLSPYLQSNSGTYLGDFSSPYSLNSIYNSYGSYGSPYSPYSVNNPYGSYGSPYSPYSATNPYTVTPPRVVVPGIGTYPYSANPYAR